MGHTLKSERRGRTRICEHTQLSRISYMYLFFVYFLHSVCEGTHLTWSWRRASLNACRGFISRVADASPRAAAREEEKRLLHSTWPNAALRDSLPHPDQYLLFHK